MAVNWTDEIAKVADWDALVRVSHNMAIEKGWWDGGVASRSIYEIIANFHSEVSEAWEEYRAGRLATWYSGDAALLSLRSGNPPTPEGFWVEIADLLIRIADAAGAHRIDGQWRSFDCPSLTPSVFVCWLHSLISYGDYMSTVTACFGVAKENEHDLWATIREKLLYNATRPYRHGGKKA